MKHITVIPQGGLCNRLRVVLSAFALSYRAAAVTVEWEPLAECQANFDDLFEPLVLPSGTSGSFRLRRRRWYHRPQTRANLHWPALLRSFYYQSQWVNFKMGQADLLNLPENRIYISTGQVLGAYPPNWRALLRLKPTLQEQVNQLTAQFPQRMVGIHIRRTDNHLSQQYSSTAGFLQAVRDELERYPDTHFYLATDEPQVRDQFQTQFGSRIMMQPHIRLARNSLEGIQAAVVDLWTLAATQKIIGSYWSSFTDTAAELRNIPLQIIGSPTVS